MPEPRVSTLELFFDLVFVFTVTQLSETLAESLTIGTLAEVMLMLAVMWWMYSGYAWLTNAVALTSTLRRTLLLTGMAGFLVMALAVPEAFGEYGWLFGASYVVVNLVHALLFRLAGGEAARAMRVLGTINVLAGVLVLAGGLLGEPYRHVFWIAAPALQIAGSYLHKIEMHTIAAGHFAERHALVVIVAIGESIISIGAGFHGVHLGVGDIAVAVLGLSIAYYLWWCYFAGDDARAEKVLSGTTDPFRRARLGIRAWGYAHYPMLLGIVIASAGVKETVGHAVEPLEWAPAVALSGGVALYLAGHALFLTQLRLSGVTHRLVAAAALLATIPLGRLVAIAQLAAIPLIMTVAAIVEDLPLIRRAGPGALGDFGRTRGSGVRGG